jgi:hypothetical protein
MTAAVSPPTATPAQTDPTTGYALMSQPITLAATPPLLADGSPLTYRASSGGPWAIDVATAQAGFVFGALLYAITTTGAVQIYNGNGGWIPETSFDPADSSLAPAQFAFRQSDGTWSGTFVLSAVKHFTLNSTPPTNVGGALNGKPQYGFIAIFATPKPTASVTPTTAIRSALGTPFGIAAASTTSNVQPSLMQGLQPTQQLQNADGFAIIVNDSAGMTAAELLVSGNPTLPPMITASAYFHGVVQSSIAIGSDGSITLTSNQQVTVNGPGVTVNGALTVNGTLSVENIKYIP